jgi:transmembrane sensor
LKGVVKEKILMEEEKSLYRDLIIKFFAGEISDDEITQLKAWLEIDPENRRIFDEENELWQGTKLEHYGPDSAWINISSRLGLGKRKIETVKIISRVNFRIMVAAASLTLVVAIASFSLLMKEKQTYRLMATVSSRVETNEGEKARLSLADSTEIILNAGSSIEYDRSYNIKNRKVKLTGEAYFEVATHPEKPFIVELDRMNIAAYGTIFNIFSFSNEDRIETTLVEGAIEVAIPGEKIIKLKPGQQVVYFRSTKKAVVQNVSSETYISWKENKLRFDDTPFEEVLRRIGRKYNVNFEISNSELLELKYTATFIDETVEEVMQMLSTVSPINYKIYYRTTITDKHYLKPKIVVGKRKPLQNP